jgi:hypothetical protein
MQSLLWPESPGLFTSNFGVAAGSVGDQAPSLPVTGVPALAESLLVEWGEGAPGGLTL